MFVIKAKYLVDGTRLQPIKDPSVLIDKGKIVDVIRGHYSPVPGVEKLDFPNSTMLPGLINIHSHLIGGPDGFYKHLEQESDNIITIRAVKNAETALRSGVTTLRDTGGRYKITLDIRTAIDKGLIEGPRLIVAGRPLTTTGGHFWPLGLECDGIDAVRRGVRQVMKDGSDFVKIFATSGGTPGTEHARFNIDELQAAVEETHKYRKKIVAHSLNREGTMNAIEAGVDELAHVGFGYNENRISEYEPGIGERIAKAGISVHFTFRALYTSIQYLENKKRSDRLTSEEIEQLNTCRSSFNNSLKTFQELKKLGVRIGVGDDAGWSSMMSRYVTFDGFVYELEAMTKGGMSPLEAISSATKVSAEIIGLADRLGTIQAEKSADILIVKGEPFNRIEDLLNVQLVIKEGTIMHRIAN